MAVVQIFHDISGASDTDMYDAGGEFPYGYFGHAPEQDAMTSAFICLGRAVILLSRAPAMRIRTVPGFGFIYGYFVHAFDQRTRKPDFIYTIV